ncbi:Holliday junction resolvase RuvX [Roseimaritima ulvae]|uniref:Putative pre-16S rRNA nuclease n=1 Tax=Roseimaritima ulvae TaxID=980254 RepID=A0A5B9QWR5_9BACT|nr:Holliday junction resolvase RuvX [Roseimaritima ulvae]QEG42432.1 Putative Holliday junction resolvase [Roseimaritima ulvae]
MSEPLAAGTQEPAFPDSGRLAGVDYGTVRIGIAICDPGRILVSPLEILRRSDTEREADFFGQLVKQERIAGFVVGLPIHCDGGESDKSRESRKFALWLHQQTGLPVRLFDERFTTADATRRLRSGGMKSAKRKQRLDAVAAQVLLEAFLEAARYAGPDELPGQSLQQAAGGGSGLDDQTN